MKKILSCLTLPVIAFALVSCNSGDDNSSKDKVEIKIAHGTSESYHMHRSMEKFKEILEEDENYSVSIYPSSQFGNDIEMIAAVKNGDLTMAVPPSSFLTDEVPDIALIELPYVFEDRDVALGTLDGPWGQNQLDALKDSNLLGMGYLENGLRHLTNSKRVVRTPEDLDGLKLRTMQVPAHVYLWNDLGATAEGAPFSELYTNLSTKVFNGQENPIAHIYSQKFYEVQDYITLTGHVYTAYLPVMDLNYWNSLTEEQQTTINEAFLEAKQYQLEIILEEEGGQLEEIAQNTTYPTEIIELTSEEKKAFMEAAKPTLNHYRNELGEDAFDNFMKAISEVQK